MNDQPLPPFHLAFPVDNIEETLAFYRDLLECKTGTVSERLVSFNFWGHQVVAHLGPGEAGTSKVNEVDGRNVPVRHFGVILDWEEWEELGRRLKSNKVPFILEPYRRFEGKPREQATMVFKDPFGNALEFKAFRNRDRIFT